MSKINAWKCDICGKTYVDDNDLCNSVSDVKIYIGSANAIEQEVDEEYKDVCLYCRKKIISALEEIIEI